MSGIKSTKGVGVRYLLHQKGVPKRFSSQEPLGHYETHCEDDDWVTWTTRRASATTADDKRRGKSNNRMHSWDLALEGGPKCHPLFGFPSMLSCLDNAFFSKWLLICCYIVLVQHIAVCVKLGSHRNLCCPLFLPSWLAERPRVPPAPQEECSTNG